MYCLYLQLCKYCYAVFRELTCGAENLLSELIELYDKVTIKKIEISLIVTENGLLEKSSFSRGRDMTYVCFFVSFSNLLVCTICISSNWSLMFNFCRFFVQKAKIPVPTVLNLHKKIGRNKCFGRKAAFEVKFANCRTRR